MTGKVSLRKDAVNSNEFSKVYDILLDGEVIGTVSSCMGTWDARTATNVYAYAYASTRSLAVADFVWAYQRGGNYSDIHSSGY